MRKRAAHAADVSEMISHIQKAHAAVTSYDTKASSQMPGNREKELETRGTGANNAAIRRFHNRTKT
jgi:hypothetical protein